MAYKCSQCGHTSEQPGNCPTCNVPMVEEKPEEQQQMPSEPQAPPQEPQMPPQQPSEGPVTPPPAQ